MKLLVKFKSGKIIKYAEVDDTELDDGRLIRCRSRVVKYYVEKYETGQEFCTYPDKGRGYY